jgi:hypothetical protein
MLERPVCGVASPGEDEGLLSIVGMFASAILFLSRR